MAEIAIALVGWFVVPYINDFIKKAYGVLTEDIKSKLRELETMTLPALKAMIEAGQMDEVSIGLLAERVMEFKDAAYEVEDFVDKDEYKRLEKEAKGTMAKIVSTTVSIPSKVVSIPIKSSSVKQLENKISRLKEFYRDVSQIINNNINNGAPTNRRVIGRPPARRASTSDLTERLLGREAEKQEIVDFLLTTNAVNANNATPKFKVAVIIGAGGVGKTILAQDLYNNDPRIMQQFGLKMWLHVSENWDAVGMTRTMIQLARGPALASDNLQVLQNELKRRLVRNKFLLVLDDVWYDDQLNVREEDRITQHNNNRWSDFCAPLRSGNQDSVILITTRMKKLAGSINEQTKLFLLKGLDHQHCLALFNRHAFGDGGPDLQAHNGRLPTIANEIATEIVNKLDGLPSAAREAGLTLMEKLSGVNCDVERYCREIKSNILQNDTRNTLMWSYRMLPQKLQQCFQHLSLYPRGFKFDPTFLALSWIGAGVITDKEGREKTLEEMGCEYFDDLVSRSFFQQTNDRFFVLYSELHALAEFITKMECMRIEGLEMKEIPSTVKHLSIDAGILGRYKDSICSLEKLRTLFVIGNNAIPGNAPNIVDANVLESILKKTKRLRALRLASCSINKLPDSVGRSKHLRFLDLSNSSVDNLPKSVCRVYHLWYLDLNNCMLNLVPEDLNKLTKLQYLVSDGATVSMIPHIGRLTLLRELKEFHVKNKEGHDLGQLKKMDHLQGALRILNLEAVSNTNEVEEANLQEKSGLQEFVPEWSCNRTVVLDNQNKIWPLSLFSKKTAPPPDQEVLDKLQPPGNITKLTVRGYAGDRTPVWMQYTNLKQLVLSGCRSLAVTPTNLQGNPAALLPGSLVHLKITDCLISNDYLSMCLIGLNRLTSLELDQCACVTTFPTENVLSQLSSLESVIVRNCDNLVFLEDLQVLAPPPEASRPLRNLTIQNCNVLQQPFHPDLQRLM